MKATDINAWRVWNDISSEYQEKILSAVWCTKCRTGVRIKNFTVSFCEAHSDDVCLHEKCSVCGSDVTRVLDSI